MYYINSEIHKAKAKVPRRALSPREIAGFTLCAGLLEGELDGDDETRWTDHPVRRLDASPNYQPPRRPARWRPVRIRQQQRIRPISDVLDHQSSVKSPTCARCSPTPPPPARRRVAGHHVARDANKPLPRRRRRRRVPPALAAGQARRAGRI
jgi:hypothetical protein